MALRLLQPEVFAAHPFITAAFSTRQGGVSLPPYVSLNVGFNTDDDLEHVQENRRRLLQHMGFNGERVALGKQVHGSRVRFVSEPGFYEDTDGLVTTTPGLILAIVVADCAAVLIADPQGGVIGACHAGWRGTVAGVVPKTLGVMKDHGAVPDRLLVYVSPCISVGQFEVGPEVASQFDAAHVHHPRGASRPFVDLKGVIADQLEADGVPSGQIEVSSGCTATDTGTFFSHRAEDGVTGRMMGLIGMLE